MSLISPGVEVSVENNSFYVPSGTATVPLILFATEAERQVLVGSSLVPALGTYESNVLRSVTNIQQAKSLYGYPRFLQDAAAQPLHGDVRNEYGLLTIYKYLQRNSRCYAVRAEVDLNDDINRVRQLWASKIQSSAALLEATLQSNIDETNALDGGSVTTVAPDVAIVAAQQVLDAALYTTFAFRDMKWPFETQQVPPLGVYANGYNQSPVDTFAGLEVIFGNGMLAPITVSNRIGDAFNTITTDSTTIKITGSVASSYGLTAGTTVLVYNQPDDTLNGVYTTSAPGVGDIVTLTRIPTFDEANEMWDGMYVRYVSGPTTQLYKTSTDFVIIPVKHKVTTALTATYNSNTLTSNTFGSFRVDGGAIARVGDTVMVNVSDNQFINGAYTVTVAGSESARWVLTRVAQLNEATTNTSNIYVRVGTDRLYQLSASGEITVGVNPIAFVLSGGAPFPIAFYGVPEVAYTPAEAANLLIAAAADFQYTIPFNARTRLGSTDAERRQTIVESLQKVIATNQDIRAESLDFNLIVCPGFPELADDIISFIASEDISEEVFHISEPPMDLDPEQAVDWATSLTSTRKFSNLVSYSYPHGITTNMDGSDVFVPASVGVVNVFGYNDTVSNVWFAPAGTQRGAVSDFSRIGYVQGTLGQATTFIDAPITRGQRNSLYKFGTNINPITNLPSRGIHLMGQKTSAPDASALDRINVVRLLCHIRRQLRRNLVPFLFQPNDATTRNNINSMVSGFLEGIKVRRGLYDFAVDTESGATAENIDNNIMEVRVAIAPTKAMEFIYVKLQVVRTGAI